MIPICTNRDYAELLNPKPSLPGTTAGEVPFKKLNDIMKVDMVENRTAEEIKEIWLEYHKQKDVLVATIQSEIYKILEQRGKDHPIFIFPLPRSQGYEFFLLQFAANTVHFTPLLCYQVFLELCNSIFYSILISVPFCHFRSTRKMLQSV